MAISVYKTWSSGEILTAADLNNSFLQIINNALALVSPWTGSMDADGKTLVLDADGDTSMNAATNNTVTTTIGGADTLVITAADIKFLGISLLPLASSVTDQYILATQVFGG